MPKSAKKKGPQVRIAESLERFVELYSLSLRARGLTLETGKFKGEILEFSQEKQLEEERKAYVRRSLGLPEHYPVESAIPRVDPVTGRETLPWQEAREEAQEAFAQAAELGEGFSAAWGIGPEGAEALEE